MSSSARLLLAHCFLAGAVLVSAVQHDAPTHLSPRGLGSTWYHPASHPAHALFKRDVPTPGSQQWIAQYPAVWAPPIPEAVTPNSWLNALQAAEQAGKIPNIPISTPVPHQSPTYGGQDPAGVGQAICSSTAGCRGPGDQWDAPDGHMAIGFDDGPSEGSSVLYQFLEQQKQSATHFMIGINILSEWALFQQAFSNLKNDIAVHTWTHPYMTTMNNSQVVAQLGWTMQIIHDSTGGRVARYWRPPYGDSDNRVRAIAKEVFGLTQIQWNRDSEDWNIAAGGTTLPKVITNLNTWHAGPKSPGLIILEHELTNDTSGAFIQTYPGIAANNWTAVSTVQLFDGAYQNAGDDDGPVRSMDVAGVAPASTTTLTASQASSSTATFFSSTSTSTVSSAANNHNSNRNGAVRMRRERVSTFLLLVGTLISVLW